MAGWLPSVPCVWYNNLFLDRSHLPSIAYCHIAEYEAGCLYESYMSPIWRFVRKMSPALAGKCIAVTVACAGLAAETKMVRRQTSFLTKHRVEHTCEPYWHSNCESHCQGSEINGNLGGRGQLLERPLPPRLSPLVPLLGAGLLHRWVVAAETVGSWPPQESHRASTAFTMAAAVMWLPAPTVSRMEGGRRTRNMAKKRSLSRETPGGRCCFSFPMRMLGLRPCISMRRRNSSK